MKRFYLWVPKRKHVKDAAFLLQSLLRLELDAAYDIASGNHSLDLSDIRTLANHLNQKDIEAGILVEVEA